MRYTSEVLVVMAVGYPSGPPAPYYASLYGGMYTDPDNPSSDKIHYPARIKSDVNFSKRIGVGFWNEESSIDFGFIDLAVNDQNAGWSSVAAGGLVASLRFYRVDEEGELSELAYARSQDIGWIDENTIRMRLDTPWETEFSAPINAKYYNSSYPTLEGKPYPILFGTLVDPEQLIPTIEADNTTLEYHVSDIAELTYDGNVYDKGVIVSYNEEDYGFTLNFNPSGRITGGEITSDDTVDTGNLLVGLDRVYRMAFTRAGLYANVNTTELATLKTDIGFGDLFPFFNSTQVVSLSGFLTQTLMGVAGWYYVDEFREIHFGRLTDPGDVVTPDFDFTDNDMVGTISVDDDLAPGLSTRASYANSPGAYSTDELAGIITGAERDVLVLTDQVVTRATTSSTYWAAASSREPTPIALTQDATSQSLAQDELDRWWDDLYDVRRRFYTFTVPINNSEFNTVQPQLGDVCSLQSDRFDLLATPKNLLIRGLLFNYSNNLLTIEGWG